MTKLTTTSAVAMNAATSPNGRMPMTMDPAPAATNLKQQALIAPKPTAMTNAAIA
jgi:hypothetical protein